MPKIEKGRVVKTTTEARGAVTGHNVSYVLYAGTAFVIVCFAIVYLYYFA